MADRLKKSELLRYVRQWREVCSVQRVELRKMTPSEKFYQLVQLMQVARLLRKSHRFPDDPLSGRRHWRRLHHLMAHV